MPVVANQTPPKLPEGIHLNLGCGKKIWPGFVNIDFPSNWSGKKPDIECDLRAIPLENGYADSAFAIHVLEHFYRWETEKVVAEWARILKPGGLLVIEVPCMDKVIGLFNHFISQKKPINEQMTLWALYGDPGYEEPTMVHKWCFFVQELMHILRESGFEDVSYEEPQYHAKVRDIRVSGRKRGSIQP